MFEKFNFSQKQIKKYYQSALRDLYEGGILISEKEAKEYLEWVKKIFQKAEIFFDNLKIQKLKL